MSLSLQPSSQAIVITNKWTLAEYLLKQTKEPEEILKSIFKGAMKQLEKTASGCFEPSMKERVWNAVSTEKLKAIKEIFIFEFCDKVLRNFNEAEATEMLEDYMQTGYVKNILYSSEIQVAYTFNQKSIIEAIIKKANALTKVWVLEILEAVKKEGVILPEPKNRILNKQLVLKIS